MSYLKTVTLSLSLLFLHSAYASSLTRSPLNSYTEMIKEMAVQVQAVAQSKEHIGSRIRTIECKIGDLQDLSDAHKLELSQQRYLALLECLAWDLHGLFLTYNDALFDFEGSFKKRRPPVEVATKYVQEVISDDIQNAGLKNILYHMSIASIKKDKEKYTILARELETLGLALSGKDKQEFDLYRMILGSQLIVIPN